MKNCDEIAENVLNRKKEYEKQRSAKRKNMIKISFLAVCVVLVGSVGFSLKNNKSDLIKSENILGKSPNSATSPENSVAVTMNAAQVDEAVSENEEASTKCCIDGGYYSQGFTTPGHHPCIPIVPFDKSFNLTGELITEEEARKYLSENKKRIASSLAADRVSVDSVRFSEKGYRYVSYTGKEGESFSINQGNIDYLVYNGDKLIAILTLMKVNGEISDSTAYGARWFEGYNNFLQSHKGEELVNVWALNCHIIVAPDNTCFNPRGVDVSGYIEGIENPYEVYYHEAAVYVP